MKALLLLILLLVLSGLHAACDPQTGDSGSLLRLKLDTLLLEVQLVLVVWDGLGRFSLLLRLVHGSIFALLLLLLQVIFRRENAVLCSKWLGIVRWIRSTAVGPHLAHLRVCILIRNLREVD